MFPLSVNEIIISNIARNFSVSNAFNLSLTFVVKSVDTIYTGTFVISPKKKEVFRILDFVS